MEGGKRKVGMLRVERQEQVFEREAVLGRDAESVFPTELKAASEAEANEVTDALKEALGSVKFVTESQVEEIKAKDGGGGDGAGTSKPLAQVLSERKQQKDEAFQEQWKLIKQGKNRPLDADEIAFLESVETKKRKIEETRKAEEETEVLAFQLAREQAAARNTVRVFLAAVRLPRRGSEVLVTANVPTRISSLSSSAAGGAGAAAAAVAEEEVKSVQG